MDTVLALTWRITPGDFARFEALYPLLRDLYAGISIYAPPGCDPALVAAVAGYDRVKLSVSEQRVDNRRWRAIRQALDFDPAYVHLCDGDHALVRIERYGDDWRRSLDAIHAADCLIVGRSPEVLASYPAALRETERIINLRRRILARSAGRSRQWGAGIQPPRGRIFDRPRLAADASGRHRRRVPGAAASGGLSGQHV